MSVLDERIRRIAGDVAAGLADGLPGSSNRIEDLEQAVTSLHGTVLRLEARVDELEKTTTTPAPAAKRATRKTPQETSE